MPPSKSSGGANWLSANTLAGLRRRKALMGYLFLLPTILGILIFTAGPVIFSFGLSLFKWNVFKPAEFIGFTNFTRFFSDQRALVSFGNTFKFVILAVSLQLSLALFMALMVQQRLNRWLRYYFRTAFFLPLLMSGAAVSISLGYMFNQQFGVILACLASPELRG
jgi:multiple sugar transport system permease protein